MYKRLVIITPVMLLYATHALGTPRPVFKGHRGNAVAAIFSAEFAGPQTSEANPCKVVISTTPTGTAAAAPGMVSSDAAGTKYYYNIVCGPEVAPDTNTTVPATAPNPQGGTARPPESTLSALPPAGSNRGRVYVVTDAASAANCASGGGSARASCWSNGVSWVPLEAPPVRGSRSSAAIGTGLTGDGTPANPLKIDSNSVPQKLTGNVGWQPGNSGTLAAATCSTTTISVPGAMIGDTVAEGWPIGTFSVTVNALVTGKMWVSANDVVTVKVCNGQPSGALSFANETYKVTVLQ